MVVTFYIEKGYMTNLRSGGDENANMGSIKFELRLRINITL